MINLKLQDLSDSTDLMWSETTGEILRNNPENGNIERMYSSVGGNLKFNSVYDIELPKPQHQLWEQAYLPVYGEPDEMDNEEISGYDEV